MAESPIYNLSRYMRVPPRNHFGFVYYACTNALFLLKYGDRAGLPGSALAVFYTGLLIGGLFGYRAWLRPHLGKLSEMQRAYVHFLIVLVTAIISLVLLRYVRPLSLNTDRWSALDCFLAALFRGEFPYSVTTHLGSSISPLPVMPLIALVPWLLGDVGLLQPLVLTATGLVLFAFRRDQPRFLLFMPALLVSPAFWYEVATRSDLLSNMFLVGCAILILGNTRNPHWGWGVWGLLLSTRVLVVFPLVFYLRRMVFRAGWRPVIWTMLLVITFFGLALFPFLLWSPLGFLENNPFAAQASHSSLFSQILSILVMVVLVIRVRSQRDLFYSSGLQMTLVVGLSFLTVLVACGWRAVLEDNAFDLSYTAVALPFFLFALVEGDSEVNEGTKTRDLREDSGSTIGAKIRG